METTWVVPLERHGFVEPKDAAMLGELGLAQHAAALAEFWPSGGPVWDALAVVRFEDGDRGIILGEAKNYPGELYAGGTQAGKSGTEKALESRRRIEEAIEGVQEELGVALDSRRWLDPLDPDRPGSSSLYQTANRLAYAVWLRRVGVEAWFCHLLFLDDPLHKPTSRAEWQRALRIADQQLGIDSIDIPFAGHAFLPALNPEDVLADLREPGSSRGGLGRK